MSARTYFLSSLESKRFSGVSQCTVERKLLIGGRRHALHVRCTPPVLAQDLGFPLGLEHLVLVNRFDGDDAWEIGNFPFFVNICLVPAEVGPDGAVSHESLDGIAWGELYDSADDAREHRFG